MEHRAYQGTLVEGEILVHSHNILNYAGS